METRSIHRGDASLFWVHFEFHEDFLGHQGMGLSGTGREYLSIRPQLDIFAEGIAASCCAPGVLPGVALALALVGHACGCPGRLNQRRLGRRAMLSQ